MAETTNRADLGYQLIDAIRENVRAAQSAKYETDYIADALGVVGMHDLADRLCAMARATLATAEAVQGIHSGKLSEDVRNAEAFTGLLLKATLEGCITPARGRKSPSKALGKEG